METSSPLAALRPGPTAFEQRGLFGARSRHLGPSAFGAPSLNLRDHFTFQRNGDFFSMGDLRGSSPAASLAADLSQNFKLNDGSSPMFPTPRRALFTTAAMMDSIADRGKRGMGQEKSRWTTEVTTPVEELTTPPLPPSSSPGHAEMMDMSPLPHKIPFWAQVDVASPSPAPPSPAMDMVVDLPPPRQPSLEPAKPVIAERKKLGIRRPSLIRTKGYSTGAMPTRQGAETQLPPFKFGGGLQSTWNSSSMSLSECFQGSPPQERRPQSANSPCPPSMNGGRPKPLPRSLAAKNAVRFHNGSPINNHARRPEARLERPRKLARRSLSMFENPGEIMKPKEEDTPRPKLLQSLMSIEEPQEPDAPVLPHFFPVDQNDSIPRISRSTMLEVLDGKFGEKFTHKMIIDCRFEYEYEGGHIDGAINYNDKELLATHLFGTPMEGKTLLIFHCEYSAHRAPIMARHIRAEDRTANAEHYPRLTYPEIYILEGGYSGFFEEHRHRCYPQAYVEMNAAEHVNTCEREMGRLRNTRRGLGRAQTFAFGQQSRPCPTSANSSFQSSDEVDMLGASPMPYRPRNAAAANRTSFQLLDGIDMMGASSPILGFGTPARARLGSRRSYQGLDEVDMLGGSPMLGASPILGHHGTPARRTVSF